ncbi:MAG: cytochrome c3 family protein [Deltaproteobacteria bacterium]|nr:cytochrome c3 family protein [Deltaproteobacteria bacterium]
MNLKLILVLLFTVFILVIISLGSVFPNASNQGYTPTQPIAFSHKIHVGTNKIGCMYCHTGAERSRHATVPALSICMNCHRVVGLDKPDVQRLLKNFQEKKPIEWIRVHELADYVYFPHKRHVKVGVACEICHGDVKNMDVIEQYAPLTMGWCIDCHRGITTPKQLLSRLKPKEDHYKEVCPTHCTACHN